MRTQAERDPVVDQLRRAVRASGRSITHLSKDAEIDRRALARLLDGQHRGCQVWVAETLAEALGLKLALVPGRRAAPAAKGKAKAKADGGPS